MRVGAIASPDGYVSVRSVLYEYSYAAGSCKRLTSFFDRACCT